MDKNTLEKMATSAFQNVQAARDELFTAAEMTISSNETLENAKKEAALSGKLDGKNAEMREAQAHDLLSLQFDAVTIDARHERATRYKFDKAQIEVDTVKTLLRIAELP